MSKIFIVMKAIFIFLLIIGSGTFIYADLLPQVQNVGIVNSLEEKKIALIEKETTTSQNLKDASLSKENSLKDNPQSLKSSVSQRKNEDVQKALLDKAKQAYLESLYREGLLLYRQGEIEASLKRFQRIEKFNPHFKDTQKYLAQLRLLKYKKEKREELEEKYFKYELGPDDILSITVLNHPELSGKVVVEPGGEIILPLVNEVVKAQGLTKDELAEKIKEVLKKYVKDPQVFVVITGYNSKKWYILGEVARPGEYPMGKKKLTLMEALYRAGLIREGRAAVGRVLVIKPHKSRPTYRSINVANIIYKGLFKDNIYIDPGTIIYVPKTVVAKIGDSLGTVVYPLIGQTKTGLEDIVSVSTAARAATPIKHLFGPTPKK